MPNMLRKERTSGRSLLHIQDCLMCTSHVISADEIVI